MSELSLSLGLLMTEFRYSRGILKNGAAFVALS